MVDQRIAGLIAERKPGHDLPHGFYRDPDIYERDIQRIFLNSWLYAGHQSEIPNVGDYLLFNFADESVIIVRSENREIHALLNVCRHRGSRVCLQSSGCESQLVCRYHGWTYGLDGALKGAAQMPESFDKSQYGLKRIHVKVLQGLVFVNFAKDPVSFEVVEKEMSHCLAPYAIEQAKVAHRHSYPIAANWKLAVANYCECYHCRPSHPEYARGHALAIPEGKWPVPEHAVNEQAAQAGFCDDVFDRSWLDAGKLGTEREHDRYPLMHGHLTGSRDGKPLAPLMGEIREFVGVATDIQVGPVLFGLAYCDHIVLYRFTPVTIDSTICEVSWLVKQTAEEGKDYSLEDLTWLWDVTTIADQHIIENNQEGVNSRFFEPGPFSKMEDYANRFVDWYLAAVK
jgi:phenylpropionate dioxygenase-like ring-hydroxylating dioxygenase large terminal subunit